MNKIIILVFGLILSLVAKSQDLDDIRELASASKFKEAKVMIDKFLTKKGNLKDAEAWFFKGYIYNNLSHDSTVIPDDAFSLKSDAFDAYKKNQELDSKDVQLTIQQHIPYLDLYFEFINLGVRYFNIKNFNAAVTSFKKANEVKDYTLTKKYKYDQVTLYPLDTSLIKNIAITSVQANNEAEAMAYYKILADANVAGKDNVDIYTVLADYYYKVKDSVQFNNILKKGRLLFPENDYWTDFEIKSVKELNDPVRLFSKYEELMRNNPNNFYISYNYSVELFNHLKKVENITNKEMAEFDKLSEVLKIAIQAEEKTDVSAMVLLSNHLYRYAYILQNTIKQFKVMKPEDNKIKTEMKNKYNLITNDCINYAEQVVSFYETLNKRSSIQNANLGIVIDFLIDIYGSKNDINKVNIYKKKKAKYN